MSGLDDLVECVLYSEKHSLDAPTCVEAAKRFLDWQPDSKAPETARDVVTVFSNGVVVINSWDVFTGNWIITHPNAHVTHWRKLIKGIDTPC